MKRAAAIGGDEVAHQLQDKEAAFVHGGADALGGGAFGVLSQGCDVNIKRVARAGVKEGKAAGELAEAPGDGVLDAEGALLEGEVEDGAVLGFQLAKDLR